MGVRERRTSDIDGCVAVLTAVHDADGYPANWPVDPVAWLTPDGLVRAWIAVEDGAVVGHVLIEGQTLGRLFVAPEARGRGVANRLLDHATRYAADYGIPLRLEVTDREKAAIALYERAGWRRTGTVTADWRAPDGTPVLLHHYTHG